MRRRKLHQPQGRVQLLDSLPANILAYKLDESMVGAARLRGGYTEERYWPAVSTTSEHSSPAPARASAEQSRSPSPQRAPAWSPPAGPEPSSRTCPRSPDPSRRSNSI